jgi:hypothetical protein
MPEVSYLNRLFTAENTPNIALAVVGIIGIAIANFTMKAIQKQAQAQMDADRAWVLASVHGQPIEPLTKGLFGGYTPGIVWKIQVAGNTPARIVRERYRCRIVPNNMNEFRHKAELESKPTYIKDRTLIEGDVVFPAGHQYLVSIGLEPESCTIDEITKVTSGRATLCAYGWIEYEDTFERRGQTQFCAIYELQGGVIKSPDGTILNPTGFRIGGPPGYNYNT